MVLLHVLPILVILATAIDRVWPDMAEVGLSPRSTTTRHRVIVPDTVVYEFAAGNDVEPRRLVMGFCEEYDINLSAKHARVLRREFLLHRQSSLACVTTAGFVNE